jgi:AAA+ superfamily predicted ATPase
MTKKRLQNRIENLDKFVKAQQKEIVSLQKQVVDATQLRHLVGEAVVDAFADRNDGDLENQWGLKFAFETQNNNLLTRAVRAQCREQVESQVQQKVNSEGFMRQVVESINNVQLKGRFEK